MLLTAVSSLPVFILFGGFRPVGVTPTVFAECRGVIWDAFMGFASSDNNSLEVGPVTRDDERLVEYAATGVLVAVTGLLAFSRWRGTKKVPPETGREQSPEGVPVSCFLLLVCGRP